MRETLEASRHSRRKSKIQIENEMSTFQPSTGKSVVYCASNRRKIIRNRWWLYVMLYCNPSLQRDRLVYRMHQEMITSRRNVFRWRLFVNLSRHPELISLRAANLVPDAMSPVMQPIEQEVDVPLYVYDPEE